MDRQSAGVAALLIGTLRRERACAVDARDDWLGRAAYGYGAALSLESMLPGVITPPTTALPLISGVPGRGTSGAERMSMTVESNRCVHITSATGGYGGDCGARIRSTRPYLGLWDGWPWRASDDLLSTDVVMMLLSTLRTSPVRVRLRPAPCFALVGRSLLSESGGTPHRCSRALTAAWRRRCRPLRARRPCCARGRAGSCRRARSRAAANRARAPARDSAARW